MTDSQPQLPSQPVFNFQVPDDFAGGVYANIIGVWHTPYEFTLDFAVMQPGELITNEDGSQQIVVSSRVVARVKIPPAQVFELMQALSQNERIYEERIGPIPKPGPFGHESPMFPPEG